MNRRSVRAVRTVEEKLLPSRVLFFGVFLGLFCGLIFIWGLGDIPFYTKGQPREATVVWEIYHNGDWVLPLRNGHIIPSKPPLFHWLGTSAALALGQLSEFSIRFPSALLALLGVLLTYRVGVVLWGVEAGLVAGLTLATSFEWVRAATTARVDMTLTFFMVAAFFSFWSMYRKQRTCPEPGRRVGWLEALGLSCLLSLATLAKGPIGAALPGLVIGVFLCVKRDLLFVRHLHLATGGLLFLLIAGSWYALALWYGGEAFFDKQIMKENIERFLWSGSAGAGHVHPFYYFIPNLFLGMAPWSFFFLPLLYFLYQCRQDWAEKNFTYLIVWIVTIFVFYSISSSKRTVYILPIYPAIALLLGAWWQELRRGEIDLPPGFLTLLKAAGAVCCAVIGLAMLGVIAQAGGFDPLGLIRPFLHPKDQSNLPMFTGIVADHPGAFAGWFLGVGGALVLLIWGLRRQSWDRVFGGLVVFTTSIFLLINHVIQPTLAAARTFRPFMGRVVERVGEQPLFFFRSFDSGALYYAGRRIPLYLPPTTPKTGYFILLWEEEWERLRADGLADQLHISDTSEGTGPKGNHRLHLVEVPASLELPPWEDDLKGLIRKDAM